MYIFSSRYIVSMSAQFKDSKQHRRTDMLKEISLLACRVSSAWTEGYQTLGLGLGLGLNSTFANVF